MISQIDFTDMRKTRRSVIIASVAVLLLSSFELTSNTLQILGLEFIVSLPRIAEAARILLAILLLIFVLRSLEVLPKQIHRYLIIIDKSWEKKAAAELHSIEEQIHNPAYDPDENPFDDYDGFFYEGRWRRKTRRQKVFAIGRLVQGATAFFLEFFAVFAIGCLALFAPNILDQHLDTKTEVSLKPDQQSTPENQD